MTNGFPYTQHQTGDQEVAGLTPARLATFVEIDHEINSNVIPSLLLIQEGQLSVSGTYPALTSTTEGVKRDLSTYMLDI